MNINDSINGASLKPPSRETSINFVSQELETGAGVNTATAKQLLSPVKASSALPPLQPRGRSLVDYAQR